MNIDSIQNGVVLDHIKAGKSMDIYKYLHLDELDCSVAIIKNVRSARQIAEEAENEGVVLIEKCVSLAINDFTNGDYKIVVPEITEENA